VKIGEATGEMCECGHVRAQHLAPSRVRDHWGECLDITLGSTNPFDMLAYVREHPEVNIYCQCMRFVATHDALALECFNCGKDVPEPDVVFERVIRDQFGRARVRDTICAECKAKAEALT
jgi:hypothetical protein